MAGESEDVISPETWEAWNRLLSPLAQLQLGATKQQRTAVARSTGGLPGTSEEQLGALYKLAVELRDRLRFSQKRCEKLKCDLRVAQTQDVHERERSRSRLMSFEGEVVRLAGSVQMHADVLAQQEGLCSSLQAENAVLQQRLATAAVLMDEANRRAEHAEAARAELEAQLNALRQQAEEAHARAVHHERQHVDMMGALIATKSRVSQLHQAEGLYLTARDELHRLDKENVELKDMLQLGVTELGQSRILEAMSPTTAKSTPLFLSPEALGKKKKKGKKPGPSRAAAEMLASQASPAKRLPEEMYGRLAFAAGAISTPKSPGRGGTSGTHSQEACEMSFLGPPSATYPPDPEKYVFIRVAGGYSPKYVGVEEAPKASGWVPKDVVRLVQAFRHAYGMSNTLEWRYWEPLLLMIDEVYRTRAGSDLASLRAAQKEKVKVIRRRLTSAVAYPSAVQSSKVGHLRQQLEAVRKMLATREGQDHGALLRMAEKEIQLSKQLDEAVDENIALRRSLLQLDQMYAQETGSSAATDIYHSSMSALPQSSTHM